MARYYFDTLDGTDVIRDYLGHELPDMNAARRLGLDSLPDMARDELPSGDKQVFSVIVRDSERRAIYVADLVLTGKWLRWM